MKYVICFTGFVIFGLGLSVGACPNAEFSISKNNPGWGYGEVSQDTQGTIATLMICVGSMCLARTLTKD